MKRFAIATVLVLSAWCPLSATVKLPALISDHMVLQQGIPVRIWGTADPDARIVVELAGQKQTATSDAQGQWRAMLDPMPATEQPLTLTVRGKNTLKITDILVGEVWLCSGQSNMG